MKNFGDFINEMYKEPTTHLTNSYGWDVPERNFVDDVFDFLVNIVCEVNGISEKNFHQWDETTEYIRSYFDNNPDILMDIDEFNGKRAQYCAEYLFDKHFNTKLEIEIKLELERKKHKGKEKILHGLPKPDGFKNKKHSDGVSLGKDNKGYFCYTHRARSKSHSEPEKISQKEVTFIETTG